MRILVVEDEHVLREQIGARLREQGFAVDLAADGVDGSFMAREYPLDLAIIDLGLPGLDGLELIENARTHDKTYPILVLTARNRWQQKVEGLEAGADDYLTKPFHMEELIARIRALLRRSKGVAQSSIRSGPIALDTSRQSVHVDGETIDLTAYEYRLIEYLMMHPGKVISKSELAEHVYEEDADRDSNVIEVFIARLRRKLDPGNQINPIETLRGRGYRLNVS
ncbi:MAG: Transcriptional regulatory protein PhoP [Gammaproteobacteria bacterium]|nr:Transcriptional regulatory protein PhoP [Gammaproteobacteria bacterium]